MFQIIVFSTLHRVFSLVVLSTLSLSCFVLASQGIKLTTAPEALIMKWKLTQEQKNMFPHYVDKWVKIALNADPVTQEEAENIVWDFQAIVLNDALTSVYVFEDPAEAWKKVKESGLSYDQIVDLATFQMWVMVHSVEKSLYAAVEKQIEEYVFALAGFWIGNKVWERVWYSSGNLQIPEKIESQIKEFIWPLQDGVSDTPTIGKYDFLINEKVIEVDNELKTKLDAWSALSKLGLIYPFPDYWVVTQKFTTWKL